MKTDIQIAQEATMLDIRRIAEKIGATEDDIEMYGKNMAKLSDEYIKKLDPEVFYEMALPIMKETIHREMDWKKIAAMVQTRIEVLPDIKDQIDFFEAVPEYDDEMYTHKKMKTDPASSLKLLTEVRPVLASAEDFSIKS